MFKQGEVINAIVKSVSISNGDHGTLTAWLHLDYGSAGQGFGGYGLHGPEAKIPYDCTGKWIWRCLDICNKDQWEKIPGSAIRVRMGERGIIEAIGHLLKDDWFYPAKDLA